MAKSNTLFKRLISVLVCIVLVASTVASVSIMNINAEPATEIMILDDEADQHIDFSDVQSEQVKVGEKSLKNKSADTKWRDFWIMRGNLPNALDITGVTENGTKGAVRFWIWVESKADVMLTWNGSQFQLGAGWDNNSYVWSNWDTQIKQAGWNEIVLPFESAGKVGSPDNSSLKYILMRTGNTKYDMAVYVDDLKVSSDSTAPEYVIDSALVLSDEDGESGGFCASVTNEKAYVGEFSYKATTGVGNHESWMIRADNLARTLNIKEITDNGTTGTLRFWIYVDSTDIENWAPTNDCQVQLGAGWDKNVYLWRSWEQQIKNTGWNEIVLPFASAERRGTPNSESLTYFFIKIGSVTHQVTAYIDNIHIEEDPETAPRENNVILSEEHGEGAGFCAVISDEQVKFGDYSYKATTGVGNHESWIIRTDLLHKMDITEMTDNGTGGTVRFWIYVDNPDTSNWGSGGDCQVQFGRAWDKDVYLWTDWKSQVKKAGWNEIVLPFASAAKRGTPDNSSISYFFIKIANVAHQMTVYIDNIHIGEDFVTVPRDPAVVISEEHMESAGGFCASISDEKVKVGSNSYKATPGHGVAENWMVRTNLAKPLDMTDYQNGSLQFWIWVENRKDVILNWNGSQAQLGEGWDKNAYVWSNWDTQIVNDGWNLITLPFSKASKQGTPDIDNITYINIRMNNTKFKTVVYLDDIRVSKEGTVKAEGIDPNIVLSEEDGENGGFCASISDEKVKIGNFAYKTTTGVGQVDHWIIRTSLARPLDITKSTANATKGSLTFWIYVDDKNDARDNWNGSQVQLGKDWDKDVLVWNSWHTQIKQNGWNKIVLNFSAASLRGEPDLSNLTYINIRTDNPKHRCTVYVDNIRISSEELVSNWSTTIEGAKMFQPYEDTMRISFDGIKKTYLDTDDKTQGDSSLAMVTDSGALNIFYRPAEPADASKYNCLEFDIYVSKADFFSFGTNALELTSSGEMDVKEMSWSLASLELNEGWNHVQLSFERAAFTLDWKYERDIDLTAINYMRIYATGVDLYKDTDVVVKLDNMQFTNNGLPPLEDKTYETVNDTGLDIYLTAADGVIPDYGTFTVTNAKEDELPEAMQDIMKQDSSAKALSLEFVHDGMQFLPEDTVKVNVKRGNVFKVADDLHIYRIDSNNNITELVVEKRSDLVAFGENRKLTRYVFTKVAYEAEETDAASGGISPIALGAAVVGGVLVIAAAAVMLILYFKRRKALK